MLTATYPAARLVQRLRMEGLPAQLSADAGRYLCNAVLFESLHLAGGKRNSNIKPKHRSQAGKPPFPVGEGTGAAARNCARRGAPGGACLTGFIHIPPLGAYDADRLPNGFGWPELRRGAALILETLMRTAQGAGRSGRPWISLR
jgi:pyrrolidone-carboxylate peptidase